MKIFHDIESLHAQLQAWRAEGESIAFVPTMGNLHEGHLCLVDEAKRHADRCVVSIFVNPTQFGAGEDFDAYVRSPDKDSALLEARHADAVFLPSTELMYPEGQKASRNITLPDSLTNILCGAARPGHFDGVATIVEKLFKLVEPDVAVFGEKDYQQLLVIRYLVDTLSLPIKVIGLPTVREKAGLAMSSRNSYLDKAQGQQARHLHECLLLCCQRLQSEDWDIADIEAAAVSELQAMGFIPDYVSIRCAADLAEPTAEDNNLRILAAASLGTARLIDNVPCERQK